MASSRQLNANSKRFDVQEKIPLLRGYEATQGFTHELRIRQREPQILPQPTERAFLAAPNLVHTGFYK